MPIPLKSSSLEIFLDLLTKERAQYEAIQSVLTDAPHAPKRIQSELQLYLTLLPPILFRIDCLNRTKYRYSPQVETFLDCLKANPIHDHVAFRAICRYLKPARSSTSQELEQMRGFVSHFLSDLRTRLLNKSVQAQITKRERDAQDSFNRMRDYVNSLFAAHARYVVLRIDLGYLKDCGVELEQVQRDLQHLRANMRHNAIFDDLEGHIAKIEFGLDKGFHIHLLLFFDGQKRTGFADISYAKRIGDYWVNSIAKPHGEYWNCNADKKQYQDRGLLGIGTVNISDVQTMDNLFTIVKYFSKAKQFIKLRSNPKIRMFRTGKRLKPKTKRGAVRGVKRKRLTPS